MNKRIAQFSDVKIDMEVECNCGSMKGKRGRVVGLLHFTHSLEVEIDGYRYAYPYENFDLVEMKSKYTLGQSFDNIKQIKHGMRVSAISGMYAGMLGYVYDMYGDAAVHVRFYGESYTVTGSEWYNIKHVRPIMDDDKKPWTHDGTDPEETHCRNVLISRHVDPHTCSKCYMPKPNGICKWHIEG